MDQAEIELNDLQVGEFVELADGGVYLFKGGGFFSDITSPGGLGVCNIRSAFVRIWTIDWGRLASNVWRGEVYTIKASEVCKFRQWRTIPDKDCSGKQVEIDGKKYRLVAV